MLIQCIGFAGSFAAMISAQFRTRKIMLLLQTVSCLLWMIHYGALGALTGAISGLISLGRTLLFAYEKPWANKKYWLLLFLGFCLANIAFTWEGPQSLLAGAASCFTTLGVWMPDMKKTRLCFLADAPCWLCYSFLAGSWSGVLVESIAIISYISAIIRLDLPRRKK